MDYRRKRRLTFFTIGLIFLLSGIEYGKFSEKCLHGRITVSAL